MDFRNFALNMIKQNPKYQQMMNNPNSAELIRILETGDAEAGAKVAQNICDTYGVTKEQATQQAMNFFFHRGQNP